MEENMSDLQLLSPDDIKKVQHAIERCTKNLQLKAILLDECKLSDKIRLFLNELSEVVNNENISIEMFSKGENLQLESELTTELKPVIALMDENGKYTGIGYHGVPTGHELKPFMFAIFNIAGPGQIVDEDICKRAGALKPMKLQIGISPTCVMCPELVQSCQHVALINGNITAEMVDLVHFSELRKKFNIMSIPALIINDEEVVFGGKNIEELVELLEKY